MNLVERLYEEHNGINVKIMKISSLVETNDAGKLEEIKLLFNDLKKDIIAHLQEEEELLFPELISRMGTSASPLQMIMKEHEEIRHIITEIEKIIDSGNFPKIYTAIHGLSSKLEDHLKKENNLLYSIAHEFIDPATLKEKNRLAVQIRQKLGIQ